MSRAPHLLAVAVTIALGAGCGGEDEGSRPSALTAPSPGLTDDVSEHVVEGCDKALAGSGVDRVYCPPIVPEGRSTVEAAGN